MEQIKILQRRIGVNDDGSIGKFTMKAFQKHYKLTTFQTAHFFGQVSHETAEFKLFLENLNYSTDGLLKTFGKYFPTRALAMSYARQPEKIANRVYANRMSNGDEKSGDGWLFKGRGALQLTGKANYQAFANYLKKPEILETPDIVATEYAFDSALFFFERNKLWDICEGGVDEITIFKLTRKINGGTNGLAHRTLLTQKYYNMIK
jgi:putative chitinase